MATNDKYAESLLEDSGQPFVPRFHKKRKAKLITFINKYGKKHTGLLINKCRDHPSDRRNYIEWELIGTIAGTSQRFVWAVLRPIPEKVRKQS